MEVTAKQVAIVGGGAAGLGAAATLLANNSDIIVHLIEARKQFGGRALTDTSINDFPFDLGPLYIQDSDVNPWKTIATLLGFPVLEDKVFGYLRILREGKWVEEGTGNCEEYTKLDEELEEAFEIAKESKNKAVGKRFERKENDEQWQFQILAESLFSAGAIVESGEIWQVNAGEHQRVDELGGRYEGPNLFVKSGLGTLMNSFAKYLSDKYGKRFLPSLNTVVKSITYDKTVTLGYGNSDSLVVDACIVTVPTNVIANGMISFEPDLSKKLKTAFKLLPLGSYKKLAFEITKKLELIKPNTYYYLAHPKPEGVWQYFRLPHRPDVLVVHTFGDFALKLDNTKDNEVYEMFLAALDNAYPDAKILGYFEGGKRAMSNWTNDPFSLGAYSYTAVKEAEVDDETALNARLVISEPVKNVLYFAGEANNIAKYATIAGAYEEGGRAAGKVLERLFRVDD